MVDVELKDTLNKHWKDDKNAFGFKMLQKMGWKENTGLGKEEIGKVEVIRVKKREEGLGLGMESISNRANNNWGNTATSFNSVLDALKASYVDTKKDKKSKKDKKNKKKIAPNAVEVGMKYKKRKLCKDLTVKSTDDLTSILGVRIESNNNLSTTATPPPTTTINKRNKDTNSIVTNTDTETESQSSQNEEKSKKKSKKEKKSKKSKK